MRFRCYPPPRSTSKLRREGGSKSIRIFGVQRGSRLRAETNRGPAKGPLKQDTIYREINTKKTRLYKSPNPNFEIHLKTSQLGVYNREKKFKKWSATTKQINKQKRVITRKLALAAQ